MKFWWFGCHERVIHQGNTFCYSWLSAQPSNSFMRRESNRLCHTYGKDYEFPMIHERHILITLTMQLWNWIVLWLMNGEFNVCSPFSWREIFCIYLWKNSVEMKYSPLESNCSVVKSDFAPILHLFTFPVLKMYRSWSGCFQIELFGAACNLSSVFT